MAPLKLHWSHSKPNFGDWLSPLICEYLSGRPIVHAEFSSCDLVAVGSLLQRATEHFWNRRVEVWGTGHIAARAPAPSRHHYHALRGPLSAACITNHSVQVFGDPGLLVDRVFGPSKPQRRTRLGIVPHYRDQEDGSIAALAAGISGSRIIDVFDPPPSVVAQIASCDFVVSSSLHGLVVADSYRVPNCWLKVSDRQRGEGFKYADYYGAFGLDAPEPLRIEDSLPTLDDIATHIGDCRREELETLKDALCTCFPFLPR
ncbi:MAG: polysaccharide pyruvyl transferase family protein [Pseudomonadales bacterium]|nr:polysaccharide pyruvyl transferase family protein [Pseudomonadales bacterium]